MEKFSEDLILKVTVDPNGNICYMPKSDRETVSLNIIINDENNKNVLLIKEIIYPGDDSNVFLTSIKNTRKFTNELVDDDAKNFVRRIIFSHFNNFSSIKRNEGLYDAEILAYSNIYLG